jgi:hypothetical protein
MRAGRPLAFAPMRVAAALLLALGLLAGCGGDGTSAGETGSGRDAASAAAPPSQPPQPLEPARCPAGAANCARADGRIIFVERVDPDGDGDAHFVLASDESVTAPGISVIDVPPGLRPDPLPGPGERISAAGPVYRGSLGQRQIQADTLHVGG